MRSREGEGIEESESESETMKPEKEKNSGQDRNNNVRLFSDRRPHRRRRSSLHYHSALAYPPLFRTSTSPVQLLPPPSASTPFAHLPSTRLPSTSRAPSVMPHFGYLVTTIQAFTHTHTNTRRRLVSSISSLAASDHSHPLERHSSASPASLVKKPAHVPYRLAFYRILCGNSGCPLS